MFNSKRKAESSIEENDIIKFSEDVKPKLYNTYDNKNQLEVYPISPIIFFNGLDSFVRLKNDMPYTAPIDAFTAKNIQLFTDPKMSALPNEALQMLDYNNLELIIIQSTEYIKRNTYLNFCAMIDGCGDLFGPILSYCPIKEMAHKYLFDKVIGFSNPIDEIIRRFFMSDYQFGSTFIEESDANTDIKSGSVPRSVAIAITNQLSIAIYSLLSYAINDSISETYLNIYNIPNIDVIYEKASEILNIEKFIIDNKESVPIRLDIIINQIMVRNLDKLMAAVVCPSLEEIITGIPTTSYFAFQALQDIKNIDKI